ncbi:MAG: leucine--tRNA ligase [Deltaproteobacteria bacterium]|nr:leucine--tRNA ligase [Deltaproteobacteria bacterium]
MTEVTTPNVYHPAEIEEKWQNRWAEQGLYDADIDSSRKPFYAVSMLPYPSGDLHIGHWYALVPSDARARFQRMQGFNVMFPIGFDAFGLPAENAAIKHNVHPKEWTYANIERMRGQLRTMGTMFDWRREMVSCDPKYYRWTQWFFTQLFKGDLAYRKSSPVDWCPHCNTTLAREQVWGDDRHCERCDTPVIKRQLEQWFFRTTNYADELLSFSGIEWPERVRTLQTNWIGRSEGAHVTFQTEALGESQESDEIEVFTTRADTLWGATFMVLAPEHPLVDKITTDTQREQVEAYIAEATRQTDVEREATDQEKTGVFTGAYAINPASGARVPIWIADYVLMTYGSGAIMAVPAGDQRDFEFARKYGLDISVVIQPEGEELPDSETMTAAVSAKGVMIHSGPLTGTDSSKDMDKVLAYLEEKGIGRRAVNFRLRDWLISRQRYWGTPIPIVYCPDCGAVPVPDDQLPVELPEDVDWRPTGESPLKLHPTWRQTPCPQCGQEAERETDTMDTFMCSSWYHLRYLSPDYDKGPFDPAEYDYWMPVATYTGGIEHANMHLIYTRFFHKACRDLGILSGDEPMTTLRNQGIILGEDSEKMSKSRGNVVAPDALVERYGTDTIRAYLMFFARWEQGAPWDSNGIEGTFRWLRRVWALCPDSPVGEATNDGTAKDGTAKDTASTLRALKRKVHQTLASVAHDYENFEFNTIVSSLMELLNEMYRAREAGVVGTSEWNEAWSFYLRMLAPTAPHIAEELWQRLWPGDSVHVQSWPEYSEEAAAEEEITLVLQVNGKVRDRLQVAVDIDRDEAEKAALASEIVQKFLDGKEPRKVIYVPGRLVNVVV